MQERADGHHIDIKIGYGHAVITRLHVGLHAHLHKIGHQQVVKDAGNQQE